MSLYKYAQACNGLVSELKEGLTKEDISEIRKECRVLGLESWFAWLRKHQAEILLFVEATASARSRKKAWKDPVVRRRLHLAGIHYLLRAHDLLKGIEDHFLVPGGSYREMAAKAGQAYFDIFYSGTPFWPFDPPDPFK